MTEEKKKEPNFILKKDGQLLKNWLLDKAIHYCKHFEFSVKKELIRFYFYFLLLFNKIPQKQIGYITSPIYARFKKSIFITISKWFRFLTLLTPLTITIRLLIDYQAVWWWWTLLMIFLPLTVPNLILFIEDCAYRIRKKIHDLSIVTNKYVIGRSGQPGGGKTSSLFYDMKILADLMWKQIKNEYKLLEPYLNQIPFWSKEAREEAEEIIEAYRFYLNSKGYPCFFTSVPAFIDGVPAHSLTADHLMQRKRLPYGAVCILDEVSLILPQELFRDKPIELREFFKFVRHLGEFHVGTTEQGKDNMFIDLRRSMSENKNMIKQKWVLKPRLLIWLFNFILDHSKKMTNIKATFLRLLQRTYNCIGWRKYYYYETETMADETTVQTSKTKTFILPPYLNIDYDNKAFKHIYRCEGKPLEENTWEHKRLSKEEITEIFTKELLERRKEKKSKKEIREEARERTRQKKLAEKQEQGEKVA